jgi:hypothetical protein
MDVPRFLCLPMPPVMSHSLLTDFLSVVGLVLPLQTGDEEPPPPPLTVTQLLKILR